MLHFMKHKILIPLLVVGALAAFFSFRYGGDGETADSRRQLVLKTVMSTIREEHFAPKAVDDSLSYHVYHKILDQLDYDKKFFSAQDMNSLKGYEYAIDDQINAGSFEFFDKLNVLFSERINDAEGYYKEILGKPFSFDKEETIQLNGEKLDYAADKNALKQRWYEYLKYRALAKYVDLKKDQEKKRENKDSVSAKFKTDAQLEVDARESVRKNQEFYFKRLRKIKDNDRFAIFVNAITTSEDPHTDYFPPKDKQRFDESMSGSFSGIGAQLKDDEGKIKIVGIVPGSPSWKQGELKAGDEIIKVAQASAEPEDVQGFDIDDVIPKIRGRKGTEVRLTVKKMDGSTKVIPIIRGDVLMEEVFAKSAIINSKTGPVGYIYLPEFYADFNDRNGRRCAEDVAIEVEKLKNSGVTGIILDLRNNGGGSLNDVVDMAGLFVDQGPMVQVKNSGSAPQTYPDRNKGTLYDGPLAIMVNQNSASASEIMAAAMQDYQRAIIVGAPTFGKGTVQRLASLDERLSPMERMALRNNKGAEVMESNGETSQEEMPIGAIKITVQKFYRINGGSTQLKGVTPDIIFPDPYHLIEMGERRDKAALKWDEIAPASYKKVPNAVNVPELAANSKKRMAANPTFDLIDQSAERLKKQEEDNTVSLNEAKFRKEMDEANATSKKMEELEKKGTPLEIVNIAADLDKIKQDSSTVAKNADWLKSLKKDLYLSETVNIISDMNKSQMKVNMGTGMK
jgi:carboxyl-terminal processing protease